MSNIFPYFGFVQIDEDNYEKRVGLCHITLNLDDFGGIRLRATMDKSKVKNYSNHSDLMKCYDSEEEFQDRFNKDFENWKRTITNSYE